VNPIVGIVSLAVFAWIFIGQAYGAGENKLTVAMLRSATQTPYYVAAEAGLFKSYGLEVLPVQFSGGTQSLMALISGDVQLNTSGGPAAINAMMKGGGVVIIATNVGVFPYILYAHPAIKTAEDLTGKRVGVAGLGGVTHFAMLYALRKLGLNPDSDVTMTAMGDAGAPSGSSGQRLDFGDAGAATGILEGKRAGSQADFQPGAERRQISRKSGHRQRQLSARQSR
jgi:ABC-type nitrate/sulfonate/bicarbonate transport system substrate-binding protein